MNTTTNRGAMGDDDDATINDDAMRETATTRWVRGHYDETRRDATRRDETRRNATQLRRHDSGICGAARERRREAHRCWRRLDLTINMRWGERGDGGKMTKATTGEVEMPRGQRSGGNSGRGTTMAAIAGGYGVQCTARASFVTIRRAGGEEA